MGIYMLRRRTDLALEINEIKTDEGKNKGIAIAEETINGFHITTVTISPEGETEAGKPAGKYITVDVGRIWESDRNRFETAAKAISN
ncbi:GPR endopeptidase, partial [bacterium]|nr:GPR endopeptidase [bacterium]